ncbi:HNH endonuclease signature motif containing protein [Kutzneria chonburiensis]|uniref:DUF222 domain-containing protein n=1 Tax=Kutzneria chonburiensis TaxID=1483604 RepID=A0ABV6MLR1_9PSEU|nr:HNH endonuclease signature motif containing protein [Kutzneria chonburiensis]
MELTRDIESMEPTGAMFDLVVGVDPASLTQEDLVNFVGVARKVRAVCEWAEHEALNHIDDLTELAMATKVSEPALARSQEIAAALETHPALAERFRRGEIDLARFAAVWERTRHLSDPAQVAEVDQALAEQAAGMTRTQVCRKATALVAKADPDGYEQRCHKAKNDRQVRLSPLPDGMAQLTWILPATEAHQLFQQICADAKSLPKDERTTDEKRSDVLWDRLRGKHTNWNVRTFVTISMETLLGLTNDPGQLAGYGPIAAEAARELAMHGPFRGLLLDEYQQISAISTDTYRPTALMKETSVARAGGTCTAPGCTLPIQEHDHITPWPEGPTEATNLQGLCTWHHHRKHDNYTVTQDSDGTTHWITPAGRHHTTRPLRH